MDSFQTYRNQRITIFHMEVDDGIQNYPTRSDRINDLCRILKISRRTLTSEWKVTGLDLEGWNLLYGLAHKLAIDQYFEHLSGEQIRRQIHQSILTYRGSSPRPELPQFAAKVLDKMAKEPLTCKLYLGIKNIALPNNAVVGEVRFLDCAENPEVAEAFSRFGESAPKRVCEVEVTGGSRDLLLARARVKCERALGLVRQQHLFGTPSKIYEFQVAYDLDGTWTIRDENGLNRAGWWLHKPKPMNADFAHPNASELRNKLRDLSNLYSSVPLALRDRIDTCLDWLDVAALSSRWRVIIPALFTAMESILVPEQVGLKAEIVTVRSIAVSAALDRPFFDPNEILAGYAIRSALIHGRPTIEIIDDEATEFADFRRLWAFKVFSDYLRLVNTIDTKSIAQVISYLDEGKCIEACSWLEERGGLKIVEKYRSVISESRPEGT